MCSCWDRWGSCQLFEVPAEEVGASRVFFTPLCKIFSTQSHCATSLSSVFSFTLARLQHCSVITKQAHLNKKKKKGLQIHRCAATVKNSPRIISLCRQELKRFDLWERERESERNRRKKNQHPAPSLRASWSLTIWILWCPLHCIWQIIPIPHLRWHTVKADMILL